MTATAVPMLSESCQTDERGQPRTCAPPCLVPIAPVTTNPNPFASAVCIHGPRRLRHVVDSEPGGDCPPTTNGGNWQTPMAAPSATPTVAPRLRTYEQEVLRDSTPRLEATAKRAAA